MKLGRPGNRPLINYHSWWLRGQIIRAKNRLLLGARRPTEKKARVSGVRKSGFELSKKNRARVPECPSYAVIYFEARLKILLCTNAEQ